MLLSGCGCSSHDLDIYCSRSKHHSNSWLHDPITCWTDQQMKSPGDLDASNDSVFLSQPSSRRRGSIGNSWSSSPIMLVTWALPVTSFSNVEYHHLLESPDIHEVKYNELM